jgi:hypothetical protein
MGADESLPMMVKERAIMVRQPAATMQPPPPDIQLISKHRVLSLSLKLRLEWRRQDRQNETEQPDRSASLGDSITSSSIHVKMNPELHQIESKLHAEKQARAKTCSTTASSWHPVPAIDSSLSTKCLLGRAMAPLRRRSIGFRSKVELFHKRE